MGQKLRRFSGGLHLFVGVGALAGGSAAILNPRSPLGIPPETLQYSPFTDFLIPGLILFVLLGLGNLAAGLLVLRRFKFSGYAGILLSGALVFWIIIQCVMLRSVVFLHVLFFGIGVSGGVLALILMDEEHLFPLPELRRFLDRPRG